jgi:membrane protease YdiL (CAAX protease family)
LAASCRHQPGAKHRAWAVLAVFALNAVFNSFLGEELLFRGVLHPKMSAVTSRARRALGT